MAAAFDIESIERLVEEEDVGLLGKGAGDEGSLLLAAGELVDLPVGNIAEIHGGDGFLGFFLIDFFKTLEVSDVGKASHRDDIAHPDGEVALVMVGLGKIGYFFSEGCEWLLAPVECSVLRGEESGEEADERGFACAIGAKESEPLAAVGGE